MKCLSCEISRAKLKTSFWLFFSVDLQEIAEKLSKCYGVKYYVENNILYRIGTPEGPKNYIIYDGSKEVK